MSINARWLTFVCRVHLVVIVALMIGNPAAAAPPPPGFASDTIQVRFKEGTDVTPPSDALPASLLASVASIVPLFTLPEATLATLRSNAAVLSGETPPDLSMWFRITLAGGADAAAFIDALRLLSDVDVAEFAALPIPPTAVTPDFTGNQGYLGAAPDGVDATFSATVPGGDGSGIMIYDVEYNWLQTHEDLSKASGVALLLNSGDSNSPPGYAGCPAPCDSINREHGTAVLGEMIADNDSKGVTGIAFGANVGLAPVNTTNLGYNPANAILLAVADGQPGDVIIIEQQTAVCGLPDPSNTCANCGPLEAVQSVFDAIQTAVANRFVVVEAAGNGGVNLDQAACGTTFSRATRDSGAIIVGAGGSPINVDRERLAFSSYGGRVDLQGWGASVMTTGYGTGYTNADDPTNPAFFYTSGFSGTSSATPIVAGASADLQGAAIAMFGTPLLPFQLRSLLQQTGSPQLGDTTQNIGPRPDLQSAIARLTVGAIDLFIIVDLSGSFMDDLPVFQAQATGIITKIATANPNVRFGLARFEDYPIPPFGNAGAGDHAYQRLVDLTFDKDLVLSTIAGLSVRDGSDLPQSQLAALYQAATGAGQDLSGAGFAGASIAAGQRANFRDGATKLFLLWTDAAFHLPGDAGDIPYPGPSFATVVSALNALDPPKVMGISSGSAAIPDLQAIATATNSFAPPGGLDCNGDGIVDVPEGAPMVCSIATSGEGIGDAVVTLVNAAVQAATPVAQCANRTVPTDPGLCSAEVSIDAGSFDPDGGPVELLQSPPSPYPVGQSSVTLKVTDQTGLTDFCQATVTVIDEESPVPLCNAPATIVPPNAPISFTATATDNCGATATITGFECFKFNGSGKRIEKGESCRVTSSGDTITIRNSGGVGSHIKWTVMATDVHGNVASTQCEVVVANPGHG